MPALDVSTNDAPRVRAPLLLRIDSAAGLFAGGVMFAFDERLSSLYALPLGLYRFIAFANIAYGSYSLWLVTRSRRLPRFVRLLVFANGAWASVCCALAVSLWQTLSPWGRAHLALEAVFVGALALIEWRQRGRLAS